MPSLVDRYLDPGSRIAQKTRRSPRDGPGKSRRELYGFSKEEALGRISNELFEIFRQSPSHRVSLIVLRGLARENRAHAAHLLRSQFSCDSTSLKKFSAVLAIWSGSADRLSRPISMVCRTCVFGAAQRLISCRRFAAAFSLR